MTSPTSQRSASSQSGHRKLGKKGHRLSAASARALARRPQPGNCDGAAHIASAAYAATGPGRETLILAAPPAVGVLRRRRQAAARPAAAGARGLEAVQLSQCSARSMPRLRGSPLLPPHELGHFGAAVRPCRDEYAQRPASFRRDCPAAAAADAAQLLCAEAPRLAVGVSLTGLGAVEEPHLEGPGPL